MRVVVLALVLVARVEAVVAQEPEVEPGATPIAMPPGARSEGAAAGSGGPPARADAVEAPSPADVPVADDVTEAAGPDQASAPAPVEVPSPRPAAAASKQPGAEGAEMLAQHDRALLELLLTLADPDDVATRERAAVALGELADPRSQGPLRHALLRDDDRVREAAARALGAYRGPQVEAALGAVLRRVHEPLALRVAAAEALGAQQTETAAAILWSVRGASEGDARRAVSRVLEQAYAAFYAEQLKSAPPQVDHSGRVLAMAAMGLHGGYFMTALAEVAGGEPGALSFLGGAAVGAITPYLLSLRGDLPLSDAAWLSSTTTWGLASGLMIGGASGLEDDALLWASLGGQVAGLVGGLATYDAVPFDEDHTLLINLAGLAGMAGGAGIVLLDGDSEEEPALAALQVGLTAGLLLGAASATELEIDTPDKTLIATLTPATAWLGAWMPGLVLGTDAEDGQHVAGALLGLSLGYAGSTLLSQYVQVESEDTMESLAGGVWGSALGGGVALLAHESLSLEAQTGLLLAGGSLGALGAGLAASRTEYSQGEALMATAGTGWGLWQGLGFAALLDADGTERVGAALAGSGAGGIVAALAADAVDPSRAEVGISLASAAWGGWLGGWGMHVARKHDDQLDGDDVLLSTLVGSDLGLVLGALAVSRWVEVPEARLGWINVGGVLGMGLGTSLAAVFTDDSLAEGNLIGTASGLVLVTVATGFFDFSVASNSTASGDADATFHDIQPGFAFADGVGGPVPVLTLSGRMR